jgi:hypothetical protein
MDLAIREAPMIVKKSKKSAKPHKPARRRPKDWRNALRVYLAKAPWVDAVFAATENGTVHVYSVVNELREKYYEGLLEQEKIIEKAFPEISFEFHTWVHQGRDPSESGPPFTELVYLR